LNFVVACNNASSHTPLEDRQARLSSVECGYLGASVPPILRSIFTEACDIIFQNASKNEHLSPRNIKTNTSLVLWSKVSVIEKWSKWRISFFSKHLINPCFLLISTPCIAKNVMFCLNFLLKQPIFSSICSFFSKSIF